MSEQEILEGNKLIAEFMGGVFREINNPYYGDNSFNVVSLVMYEDGEKKFLTYEMNGLKYHCSWDWLMPVVEKIEELSSLGGIVTIVQGQCRITSRMAGDHTVMANKSHYITMGTKGKLLATYEAVVEFVKWYNSCQKEK